MQPNPSRIAFEVEGVEVVGHVHWPAIADQPSQLPAAIVAGPMTSVKEQVTGVYAGALARRGLVALALDHRHYGESGAEPRQYEHHGHKVEDLRAALTHLAALPGVNPQRLFASGKAKGKVVVTM